MSRAGELAGGCLVGGCAAPRATRLGVCEAHWNELPAELRAAWWAAWAADARVKAWTAARRACLEYLAGRAA